MSGDPQMHAATDAATEVRLAHWRAAWPEALAAWSRYTRLRDPRLCASTVAAAQEGLSGSFAMIRLLDQSVVIDLESVREHGLDEYALEILAHEIGHHVLAPGSASDHFRLLARIRRGLPTAEQHAALVANLYTDLCINDRLQRQSGLRMLDVYRALARTPVKGKRAGRNEESAGQGTLWTLYMRIYEHLWQTGRGDLAGAGFDETLDADAWLGARLIRVYGADWMRGGGRFAALVLPYVLREGGETARLLAWHDTGAAGQGCMPDGLHEVQADEAAGVPHPAHDPALGDDDGGLDGAVDGEVEGPADAERNAPAAGQAREPFEYGEILRAGGVTLDPHELAIRYYRERAQPHLVRYPTRPAPREHEPEMEGLEPWESGDPLDALDWLHSVTLSPRPIPGLTTVRRTWNTQADSTPRTVPVDLDLYVDSSGSMPNPQQATSWPALAGAIVALSALRAGASVQATLWSGKREVRHTPGFVRDGDLILRVLTGFFGGATCFPIHRLRATFEDAGRGRQPTHILMISDDGITTMFDRDERGNTGWDVAARALRVGGAGGTMALNLDPRWEDSTWGGADGVVARLKRARSEQGWDIHALADMAQLVAFARAFSLRHYGKAAR